MSAAADMLSGTRVWPLADAAASTDPTALDTLERSFSALLLYHQVRCIWSRQKLATAVRLCLLSMQ